MGKRSAVLKRLHSTARVKRLVDSYGDDVLAVKHVKSLRSAAIHLGIDAQDIRDLRDSLFDSSKTQTFLKTIRSGCISRRGGTLCFGSSFLLPESKEVKKEAGRASISSADMMFPVIDMVEVCPSMEEPSQAETASLKEAVLSIVEQIKSLPAEDLKLLTSMSQEELDNILKNAVTESFPELSDLNMKEANYANISNFNKFCIAFGAVRVYLHPYIATAIEEGSYLTGTLLSSVSYADDVKLFASIVNVGLFAAEVYCCKKVLDTLVNKLRNNKTNDGKEYVAMG